MIVLFLLACGGPHPAPVAPTPPVEAEAATEEPGTEPAPGHESVDSVEARVLASDAQGEPIVRAVALESEGCPRERVEVRDGDAWRALHTVDGAAFVQLSQSGQVGGYVSCAERLTSVFVDDWIQPHSGEPEGVVGMAWRGRILHVLAQDPMQPVQPLSFAWTPEGWASVSGPCNPLEEDDQGTVTWGDPRGGGSPMPFDVAARHDLNEDGQDELWLVAPSDGTPFQPVALVTACPGGRARALYLGEAQGSQLTVTSRSEQGWQVLEFSSPDSTTSYTYDGFSYRRAE